MFQYFVPTNAKTLKPEDIKELGLDYAIDHPVARETVGPEHRPGLVMRSGSKPGAVTPELTWAPAPKRGRDEPPYYVGWETLPRPEDLIRDEPLRGDHVQFANGMKWLVPKLMLWEPGDELPATWRHALPCCVGIDEDGNPTRGSVQPEYADLFDFGMQVMTVILNRGDNVSDADVFKFAAAMLSVNYRVSLLELSSRVIGFTEQDAMKVVLSAIDWKAYEEALGNWAGRDDRPTTDSPSGSTDEQPTTDPRSAS